MAKRLVDANDLVSVRLAAQFYCFSPRTIYHWIESGQLPAVHIEGGGVALEEWAFVRFLEHKFGTGDYRA